MVGKIPIVYGTLSEAGLTAPSVLLQRGEPAIGPRREPLHLRGPFRIVPGSEVAGEILREILPLAGQGVVPEKHSGGLRLLFVKALGF